MNSPTDHDWSIAFNQVAFQFQHREILADIDMRISSSDYILLTGQNGSGKSTLLRIIAGLLKPDSAAIHYSGIERTWSQAKKYLRRHICYLHQYPYLFNGSVFDNIAYGLRQQKLSRQEIKLKVEQALESVSLQHLADRDSHKLSGGEKQRVAIARSWIISPRLILLDEPFASMDKDSRFQCFHLINQLKNDNIAVVVTSHDPQKGELDFNQHMHLYQGKMTHKTI